MYIEIPDNTQMTGTVIPVHNGIVGSRTKVRCRQVSVVHRFSGFARTFKDNTNV
jgi:hypothetical protein